MEHTQSFYLNNDFRTCLYHLFEHGLEANPRDTTTREILNYNITLTDPRNRVITFPERKTSTKYLLGEFIWYLSGSNDPKGILPYAKFWDGIRNSGSKDGYEAGTVNSNYGTRLFGHSTMSAFVDPSPGEDANGNDQDWMPINQWQETVLALARDRDTRQAIMNIHVPSDRHAGNKDVPCLSGDTVIMSPEGDITIKDLADKFTSGEITSYPIYSWDEKTQITSIQRCIKAWKTGTKKVRRVTFSDGTSITATHDHIVWKRDMVYDHGHVYHIERPQTKIGDLEVGMTLCSVPIFTTGDGRRGIMRCSSANYGDSNRVLEHRLHAEHIYGEEAVNGMDVHHLNEQKNDNRACNLELLSPAAHGSEHRSTNNPVHREDVLSRLVRRLQLRETYEKKGLKVQPLETYFAGTGLTMNDVIAYRDHRRLDREAVADYTRNRAHKMLINMKSSAKKVITSIEELPEVDVYDFTEPINSNCVLSNGLIVHNCTLSLHWFIRENKLHLIVSMRSNDVILGFTNDVFQFTMLQEAMMLELRKTYPELGLGNYYHNAGSMHIYDRHFSMAKDIIANERAVDVSMQPMDAFDGNIIANLIAVEQAWQEAGAPDDFDFGAVHEFQFLTPYWQHLVKGFFLQDEESLHWMFGQED